MGNHYLPGWYQWRFHLILGGDFNREIIRQIQKWLTGDFKTESLVYRGDIHGKSLLTVHLILGGDFNREIICWNQKWLAGDFKTESLVYWGDIHRESLLTTVVSIAVSFDSRRGFQS